MIRMKRVLPLALLLVACQSNRKLPEGSARGEVSKDFQTIRPVAIVVLPVEAKNYDVKDMVRKTIYDGLFEKRYSPISLRKVDANLDSKGQFAAKDVDWDASLKIKVTRWRTVGAGGHWAADGSAHMIDRHTGEILWQLAFTDQVFRSPETDSESGQKVAARSLAKYLIHSGPKHLPDCPPLPSE